ncbi:MAG TPA: TPM domain-containing protein [Xanthobacteraceae bacterium]|nr:TPM domain-containing protein [Xanthobacteraceae bacterium]
MGNAPLRAAGTAITIIVFCALATFAFAFDFPPLTGRVVDQANVMTPQSRANVEAKLKDLEDKSSIQLVVATVKSLQGGDIETFANELFRFWKLGEAKKNNGVLFLIAPAEHKVRIEVGYGLEGTLTDALSSVIIQSAVLPRFKANDFSGGIERGVDGIISVLSGDTTDWQRKIAVRQDDTGSLISALLPFVFFGVFIFVFFQMIRAERSPSGRYVRRNGRMVFVPFPGGGWGGGSSSSGWGGSSGGGFDGGFSGGGGSSGGGGASGSW